MTWLAGVDGCRAGWFRVAREPGVGELRFGVFEEPGELVASPPAPQVVAIDIPIGLPTAGARECDRLARRLLGPRRSSVFPAPVRAVLAVLAVRNWEAACRVTERADGRRVNRQLWNLVPKIREVDALVRGGGAAAARVAIREVHPELCFRAWNKGVPMQHPKRTRAGRRERLRLADAWLGPDLLEKARGTHLPKDLADDDILDAAAALWTAHRIADGAAQTLPTVPPEDEPGLPMEIVF